MPCPKFANFKEIYIIGKGRVAKECQSIAAKFFSKDVKIVEFYDVNKADDFFRDLKDCLVVSVNSFYIFKEPAISQNTIINYHNSLLPKHRGVNAHIWAIYDGDEYSGITWHLVDSGIDTGKIIVQDKIRLNDKITAGELLMLQHKMAIDTFLLCLKRVVDKKFIPNPASKNDVVHKKCDFPNSGVLDSSLSFDKISIMLRAMDINIIGAGVPNPKILTPNGYKNIISYSIDENLIRLNLEKSRSDRNYKVAIFTRQNRICFDFL